MILYIEGARYSRRREVISAVRAEIEGLVWCKLQPPAEHVHLEVRKRISSTVINTGVVLC